VFDAEITFGAHAVALTPARKIVLLRLWYAPGWRLPGGGNEVELVTQPGEAVALAGTSIRNTPISRRIMEASQRLRIVAKYSVGVDDVDVEAATELGILVTHAPTESNCFGVAETTVMMILAMCKRAMFRDAEVRAG